jgi:uncharacterized membrane protein YebE (DUF533 family)
VLDTEDILNGLLRGALSGRKKTWRGAGRAVRGSGLINAQTLLAAAGVAWGLYETWQGQQTQPAAAPGTTARPGGPAAAGPLAAPPPLPGTAAPVPPSEASGFPAPILQLMRLMVSAARADGEIGPQERECILAEAREVGAEDLVLREIESPRPLGEIVAGVTDPQFKEQLYTLAFTIVRADEAVTGAERIYLAQLAHRLSMDAAVVARIEANAAARIDAAGAMPGAAR